MTKPSFILFNAPDHGIEFKAKLLLDENPDVIRAVREKLPFKSVLGHVVISGEAIWTPTQIVFLGKSNMVTRTPGAVYLYAPGQTICMTYGSITESALVNKFAQVIDEHLPGLQQLGKIVWQKTVADFQREQVNFEISEVTE
ncbi:DUF3830 family protein [Verminephrobacter aporrectodeae subsp. tuberculatae]|uniref:DUF3830 family protein n=1 Tax=Verminephrobacter aporrectodeae subsp. tuberculatae TaxID=1110392 RepID=A0ABT3KZL6_9BURK|nr:DUF3830 family protein [Verminephrobacter aporrectodeae]MCW5223405.1 DUF3830 family protein [Verminephrobacter aporrectodeae subsp. tuberculatae]MCW5288869.1 DUF3830 family protein [Verminephrobacter aporrectodeae subsp. tuberculatae]MCW5323255.1 DUF3830 family protein [Verminephrobacter aporrectodeae subsp. tuberculatae]MCW8163900.1 DUF3830 family protein [Verminephrobacter aporrectodeae subsp. tuberculatae]MCW8168134.1 DUF3830 family protein [Verminephrobacter aporrectodeae subsp. tubercu